jgi:arginyl-tRNA synthetase
MRKTDSHLDFDLELAKRASLDNPVYYIQYAHARISSILEFRKKKKVSRLSTHPRLNLLNKPDEITILKLLRQFPQVVSLSSQTLEPYRIVVYLRDLAGAFHSFYTKHRVVTDNLAQMQARILLVKCVQIVLANGLRLLGISAPKRM